MDLGNISLSPWYINTRRLALLAKTDLGVAAQVSINKNSGERAMGMRRAAMLADKVISSGKVPNLTREVILGKESDARLLGAIWGVFTFRGLQAALMVEEAGKVGKSATFSGLIPIGTDEFVFSGVLSNEHVYSTTSVGFLSGRRRAFILGQFQFSDRKVEVFPFIIGDFASSLEHASPLPFGWPSHSRVYPQMLDAFQGMEEARSVTKKDLAKLRDISENDIKEAFAKIIGEPYIPKDWGGEKSDLYSSRLTMAGRSLSAAFLLKGPAVRGPMHPANLGKRGDQLVRAFDEPADLIVVQHCDQIANSVVRQAEALAADPAKPRLYCILDGADTVRILKSRNLLGFRRPQ